MTKKYTLTTSEETVTENPEDIIRLMKLAGLTNAQAVAEEEVTEEVEAEVYEPTEANDELDLDDYSKKSPESINKQKKSIQPTLGDNPLEYSLDENEIYEAMIKEFDAMQKVDEEEVNEAQSPAQKAAFAKMLAAKNGKKDEAVEEKEETTEEKVEETDELKEEELKEDCGCGHGSDCNCGPECDCGCNESADMGKSNKSGENTMSEEQYINEDESVWNQFKELHNKMDPESEDRIFFSMKNYPKHRFELHGDIDGKDTKSGKVNVGVFLASKEGDGDDFLQNMSISQDEIKANITGAGWVGSDPAKGELKGTAGDYKEFGDVMPEPRDADQDRLAKLSGINASKKYY